AAWAYRRLIGRLPWSEQLHEALPLSSEVAQKRSEADPRLNERCQQQVPLEGDHDRHAVLVLEHSSREPALAGRRAERPARGLDSRNARRDALLVRISVPEVLDDESVTTQQDEMIDARMAAKGGQCRIQFRHVRVL